MKHIKPYLFAIIVIVLAFSAHWSLNYFENQFQDLPYFGEQNEGVYPVLPEFSFMDQNNNVFDRTDIKNKVVVANYFFTSCPTICPKMNRNMQKIQELYIDKDQLELLSFTVDPKRDTPDRLKSYADLYHADSEHWHFLTGDKKELYRLARKGFMLSASDGSGEDDDFIHSENIVLLDTEGYIRGFYVGTDPASVNNLVKDISKLLKTTKA